MSASCLVLALLLQRSGAKVALRWKPLAQPILNYECRRQGQYGAITADIRMTVTRKVLGVASDGTVALEESTYMTSSTAAGKNEDLTGWPNRRAKWRLRRKADGALVAYDQPGWGIDWPDESLGAEPLFDMVYPDHPVGKGDEWTYRRNADRADQRTLRQIDYRFEGTERIASRPCNKVSAKLSGFMGGGAAGGKVTGSGTFWLSVEDGAIIKSDLSIDKPDLAPIILHETIVRKE